jgi:hypothetical protein
MVSASFVQFGVKPKVSNRSLHTRGQKGDKERHKQEQEGNRM